MPEFKNKEEYHKWKTEREKQAKREAELKKIWICPECLSSNDTSQLKCNCGYSVDETLLKYFRGNLTSSELYKSTFSELNNKRGIFLSHYLIKRFPNTDEAKKIKEFMDSHSIKVTCGKCGTSNVYNPEYYKKDKCEKCGDWLYQYIKPNQEYKEIIKSENLKQPIKITKPLKTAKKEKITFKDLKPVIIFFAIIIVIILLLMRGAMSPNKHETSSSGSSTYPTESSSTKSSNSDSSSQSNYSSTYMSPYNKGYARGQAIAAVFVANISKAAEVGYSPSQFMNDACDKESYGDKEYREGCIAGFKSEAKYILDKGKRSID